MFNGRLTKANLSRREFLKMSAVSFAALSGGSVYGVQQGISSNLNKNNVIVILADDLGYGSLSCYGSKKLQTPFIDSLASQGVRFTHAYAPSSVCSPTRYALMTGRYYWRTDVERGKVLSWQAPLHIEQDRLTLASLFKDNGYKTGCIGKWHLGIGDGDKTDWNASLKPGPLEVGFDYFFGISANLTTPPDNYIENYKLYGRSEERKVYMKGRETFGLSDSFEDSEVQSEFTDKAVDFIEKNKDDRFFLYFSATAIHEPIVPNESSRGDSGIGLYGDFIKELDGSVGRILQTLDRLNLTKDTLVIFTSDNGGVKIPHMNYHKYVFQTGEDHEALKQAQLAGFEPNGPLRGRKGWIYEGGFRMPFIVRWPGRVPRGEVCDKIICLSDVLSTFAGLLDYPLAKDCAEDSFDISSLLFDPREGKDVRDSVVMQSVDGIFAIRKGPWKYIEKTKAPDNVSEGKRKFIERQGAGQLFNLERDPYESLDLSGSRPDVVKELSSLLDEYRSSKSSRPRKY